SLPGTGSSGIGLSPATDAATNTSPGPEAVAPKVRAADAPLAIGARGQTSRCPAPVASTLHACAPSDTALPARSIVTAASPLASGPRFWTVTVHVTVSFGSAGLGDAEIALIARSARCSAETTSAKLSSTTPPRPSAAVMAIVYGEAWACAAVGIPEMTPPANEKPFGSPAA